jgi:hypothetical protein
MSACGRCATPIKCAIWGCSPGTWPTELSTNHIEAAASQGGVDYGDALARLAGMAQSTAERQKAFKAAQKAAGLVRLEAYVTKDQRIKFRALGGDPWLRKKIDRAKVKK